MPEAKGTIFISHIHEETELAATLSNAIRADFLDLVDVFCSTEIKAIDAGADWLHEIRQTLSKTLIMCVLCSHESIKREWINMEIGAAWGANVEIVPVLHSSLPLSSLMFPLNHSQAVQAESIEGLEKLYNAISGKIGCGAPAKSRLFDLQHKISQFEERYSPARMAPRRYAESLSDLGAGEYKRMLDGTVKQLNPVTGTVAWTVPGRSQRPVGLPLESRPEPLTTQTPLDCRFCEGHYLEIPPEKARVDRVGVNGEYKISHGLKAEEVLQQVAEFRRVANLYEIIGFDYWRINYNHELSAELSRRRDEYYGTPLGKDHVQKMVAAKRNSLPNLREDVLIDSLFGGSHDLIIANRHFASDATENSDRVSSGELSPDEHFWYFRLAVQAIIDQHRCNHHIEYVAVFQNWLAQAGASQEHLHKQVVGIDELALPVARALVQCARNRNFFNEKVLAPAIAASLVFAENEHAVALVETGRRFPTIGVYAKGVHGPGHYALEENAVRGMSDLVHACHAALGKDRPSNEEWYYRPKNATGHMPWHVLLLSRQNVPAGFEHSTRIYINPLSPEEFCRFMVEQLQDRRVKGKIARGIKVDGECSRSRNSLQYVAEDE